MLFRELRHEQARQLVDLEQIYASYSATRRESDMRFAGSMFWRDVAGRTYLYRKTGRTSRSLGAMSPETERIHRAFHAGRDQVHARLARLATRLDEMAPVNRALWLGRLPLISARILRHLAAMGLVGRGLVVAGTTALFAYERQAAVQVESGLLATGDIDLLFDARRRLRLAADGLQGGLIEALRKVDRSFTTTKGSYRATNADGFMVDLIEPPPADRLRGSERAVVGERDDDLQAAEIEGLEWLVNSPKLETIVVDERGFPLSMTVPDPRSFALHKAWVGRRSDREPIKRGRDLGQARLVARLVTERSNLTFDDPALSALPAAMRDVANDLVRPAAAKPSSLAPDW